MPSVRPWWRAKARPGASPERRFQRSRSRRRSNPGPTNQLLSVAPAEPSKNSMRVARVRRKAWTSPGAGGDHAASADSLGATKVIWLGAGIAGDDTHGHVDDLARFVSPTRVLLCREIDPGDANYRPLEENRERLQGARNAKGERIEVVELPMPRPVFLDGQRLPASYANFYVANAAVLVPTFNDLADREALGILAEQFPDRPVVGIHSVDLVWGLGTLHCLSQQQPAR